MTEKTEILLITGIADPRPLKKRIEANHQTYQMIQYPDHHIFTIDDWHDIKRKFEAIGATDKIILTTEKDAVRLEKFSREIGDLPVLVLPVSHRFLFDEGDKFNNLVTGFIKNFKIE